jgi:hypothetical protein
VFDSGGYFQDFVLSEIQGKAKSPRGL